MLSIPCWQEAYPHTSAARAAQCAGVFYGGDGSSLGANIIFALALIAWAGAWSSLAFGTLWHLLWLRQHAPPGVNIDDSTHNNHVLKVVYNKAIDLQLCSYHR